jgi:hypothetical protein
MRAQLFKKFKGLEIHECPFANLSRGEGPNRGRPVRSILEGRSRTVVSRRTSVAKRDLIAVSSGGH